MSKNLKSAKVLTVGFRMRPDLWAAVQKVAELTSRSAGGLMGYAVELYILKNYPEAMEPKAKVTKKLTLSLGEAAPVDKARPRRRAGGVARAESLTPERRKKIAQKGAEARWGGHRPPKAPRRPPTSP